MIIRPGQLIDAASGTLGSMTFATGRSGQVVKRRQICVERGSEEQRRIQAAQNYLVRNYQNNITTYAPQLRAAMALATITNRLGRRTTMTPFALFLRWAMPYYLATGRVPALPMTPIVSAPLTSGTIAFSLSGAFNVTLNMQSSNSPFNRWFMRCTRSHRTTYPALWKNWRMPVYENGISDIHAWTYDIRTAFVAAVGTPSLGETVAVGVRIKNAMAVGIESGELYGAFFDSPEFQFQGTVVA